MGAMKDMQRKGCKEKDAKDNERDAKNRVQRTMGAMKEMQRKKYKEKDAKDNERKDRDASRVGQWL